MSKEIGKKLDHFDKSIYHISNKEFNINSTQQLAIILFDDLELPMIKNEVLRKMY